MADSQESAEQQIMEAGERVERRVAMTRMQQNCCCLLSYSKPSLTTFNEVDMSAVITMQSYQDEFVNLQWHTWIYGLFC